MPRGTFLKAEKKGSATPGNGWCEAFFRYYFCARVRIFSLKKARAFSGEIRYFSPSTDTETPSFEQFFMQNVASNAIFS